MFNTFDVSSLHSVERGEHELLQKNAGRTDAEELTNICTTVRKLEPGVRMVTQLARTQMIDNANHFGRLATKCDLTRSTPRRRKDFLLDYQDQQTWKAEKLSTQILNDAALKKGVAVDGRIATTYRAESARVRQDIRAGVARWVSEHKRHERKRAAQDEKSIRVDIGMKTAEVDRAGPGKVLTLDVDASDDDYFLATLSADVGEDVIQVQVERDVRFCTLEKEIAKNLRCKFALALPNGISLTGFDAVTLSKTF